MQIKTFFRWGGGLGAEWNSFPQLQWHFTSALRPCPSPCRISLLFLKGQGSEWISQWLLSQYPQPTPWVFSGFSSVFPVRARWGSWRESLQKGGTPFYPSAAPRSFALKLAHTQPLAICQNFSFIFLPYCYGVWWLLSLVNKSLVSQKVPPSLSRFWNGRLLCELSSLLISSLSRFFLISVGGTFLQLSPSLSWNQKSLYWFLKNQK